MQNYIFFLIPTNILFSSPSIIFILYHDFYGHSHPFIISIPSPKNKKKPGPNGPRLLKGGDYLLSRSRSTIGVARFNFSVRNGKRWSPRALITLMRRKWDRPRKRGEKTRQRKGRRRPAFLAARLFTHPGPGCVFFPPAPAVCLRRQPCLGDPPLREVSPYSELSGN